MKVLQVIETAFRATLEEQDDTVLWLTHVLQGAGADVAVLLSGDATAYVASGCEPSGLILGEWRQTQPPRLDAEVYALMRKSVRVYAVDEDLVERGVAPEQQLAGLIRLPRNHVGRLFDEFDRVWCW